MWTPRQIIGLESLLKNNKSYHKCVSQLFTQQHSGLICYWHWSEQIRDASGGRSPGGGHALCVRNWWHLSAVELWLCTKRVTCRRGYILFSTKSCSRSSTELFPVTDPALDTLFIRSVFTKQHWPSLAFSFWTTESSQWMSGDQCSCRTELLLSNCNNHSGAD